MRIAITGAAGQVGHDLTRALADDDVIAWTRDDFDLTDRDAVRAAVFDARPDWIAHPAAWTAVDACETEPERAMANNAAATRWIAQAADAVGARLLYLSTDYVFDGTKVDPYDEWDTPAPTSVYGRSKLGGEMEATAVGGLIVRVSLVCGIGGPNLVKTILRLIESHDTLRFVDDQRWHPTFCEDLAPMLRRLMAERAAGTWHVTNQGATTPFQFARDVLTAAGADPDRVLPISAAELDPPRPAPRPANSVLANTALAAAGIPLLPDHREPLARLVKEVLA